MKKYRITQDGYGYYVEVKFLWIFWIDVHWSCEDGGFGSLSEAREWIQRRVQQKIVIE